MRIAVGRDVAHRVVQRLDLMRLRALQELASVELLKARVPRHGEVRAVEL